MLKLFLNELRARRGAIIGWGIGLAVFGGYIIILYPQFAEPLSAFNLDDIAIYQVLGNFGDFASFPGFLSAEMFTFLPVLLAIYAIVNGTGTLAGEEDSGRLEPLIALPIPRWQVVLSKALALGTAVFIILLIVSAALAIAYNALPSDVDTLGVEAVDLVLTTLAVWPLVMVFAMLSLFLAAYLPTRRIASTVAMIVLIVSYFGNNLGNLIEALQDLQFLFPFYYFNGLDIMTGGVVTGDLLILLGATMAFLVLALLSFQRRNVTVGAWPWQRARIETT